MNLFDYLLFVKPEEKPLEVPTGFYKCGKCCIKEGMSKTDRMKMFHAVEREVDSNHKDMYCHSCKGRFIYENGTLTTMKGGE